MKRYLVGLTIAALITGALVGCGSAPEGGSKATTGEQPVAETETPVTAESAVLFDASNYSTLATNPKAHKGARIDVVGRVLGAAEQDDDGTYFQMFADPKNYEWNTIVAYPGAISIAADDYVRVTGTVKGEFKGQNAFGGDIIAVQVLADSVEVVDATAAGAPPTKTATVGTSSDQHGLTVAVDKIEFTPDDTRVYVTVTNATNEKASFYSFNAKAVQGSTQFDADGFTDYPEVQSELLPGVSSSGVVVFDRMDESQALKLVFEARSDDWNLDFTPYNFTIEP